MADPKLITEESFAEHPEWAAAGLKIGDKIPKEKKNTVEVDVATLQQLLNDVGDLKKKSELVDQLQADNKMLLEVADKGRVQNYQAKNNPKGLVRTARAWMWNGALVKATYTVKNSAFTDSQGRIHTDQVLNVIMEDGSEKEIAYDQFNKERTLLEGDIIKRSTDEESGQTFYTLKFKDGKAFTVNQLFTN